MNRIPSESFFSFLKLFQFFLDFLLPFIFDGGKKNLNRTRLSGRGLSEGGKDRVHPISLELRVSPDRNLEGFLQVERLTANDRPILEDIDLRFLFYERIRIKSDNLLLDEDLRPSWHDDVEVNLLLMRDILE